MEECFWEYSVCFEVLAGKTKRGKALRKCVNIGVVPALLGSLHLGLRQPASIRRSL